MTVSDSSASPLSLGQSAAALSTGQTAKTGESSNARRISDTPSPKAESSAQKTEVISDPVLHASPDQTTTSLNSRQLESFSASTDEMRTLLTELSQSTSIRSTSATVDSAAQAPLNLKNMTQTERKPLFELVQKAIKKEELSAAENQKLDALLAIIDELEMEKSNSSTIQSLRKGFRNFFDDRITTGQLLDDLRRVEYERATPEQREAVMKARLGMADMMD